MPPQERPAPSSTPHASADTPPLVPARMVNEYVYCPRLAYLEWVQGEWVESSDTVEGRHAHRRVNRDGGVVTASMGKLPPRGRAPASRCRRQFVRLLPAAGLP